MNIIKREGKTVDVFPDIEGLMIIKGCEFEDCDGVEGLFKMAIQSGW